MKNNYFAIIGGDPEILIYDSIRKRVNKSTYKLLGKLKKDRINQKPI